ncbi:hypothetical protein Tco_0068950, partial [Tanacetum coccineum]
SSKGEEIKQESKEEVKEEDKGEENTRKRKQRSGAEDAGVAPHKHPDLKTAEKPIDKGDQVFLYELERLKRQEKDTNDAAEALRKEFAQQTEDLLLQAGATRPSSTNIVNTASTPVSTASTDNDLPNPDQDDSEIPALEDIYKTPTNGIFTHSSYDDEGAVADFTNLETDLEANKAKDSGRRSGKQEEPKALVTLDGEGVDWTSHSEDEKENYALMAYSNSGSDTEVTSCSKECKE